MHFIKGVLACIALLIATVSVFTVLAWWVLRLNFTKGAARSKLKQRMDNIIIWWTRANRRMISTLGLTHAHVQWHDRTEVSPNEWYLVICNHQTWADILLLQTFFTRRDSATQVLHQISTDLDTFYRARHVHAGLSLRETGQSRPNSRQPGLAQCGQR